MAKLTGRQASYDWRLAAGRQVVSSEYIAIHLCVLRAGGDGHKPDQDYGQTIPHLIAPLALVIP